MSRFNVYLYRNGSLVSQYFFEDEKNAIDLYDVLGSQGWDVELEQIVLLRRNFNSKES